MILITAAAIWTLWVVAFGAAFILTGDQTFFFLAATLPAAIAIMAVLKELR